MFKPLTAIKLDKALLSVSSKLKLSSGNSDKFMFSNLFRGLSKPEPPAAWSVGGVANSRAD